MSSSRGVADWACRRPLAAALIAGRVRGVPFGVVWPPHVCTKEPACVIRGPRVASVNLSRAASGAVSGLMHAYERLGTL